MKSIGMSEVGMLQKWNLTVDLLGVGLPMTFVAHAVGMRGDSKKLLALRDEVSTERRIGCCPTSLTRQLGSHRRRLESSLFLGIYTICGGEETFRNVNGHAFVLGLRWYWKIRREHCLDGVKMVDARIAWLLAQGLASSQIVKYQCPRCNAPHFHFVESTRMPSCPVCDIEDDWRMRRSVPATGWVEGGIIENEKVVA